MLKRYGEEALEESAAPMGLRRRTISTAPRCAAITEALGQIGNETPPGVRCTD